MGTIASVPAVLALLISGLAVFGLAAPAQAAPGDGTVQIRVVQDYNANGKWDDAFIEPGLAGVTVTVTGENGAVQTLVTDAEGLVTVVGAPGSYRIQAINPDPEKFQPAFARATDGNSETPSEEFLSSNDEFVTVEADETVSVTTAFWEPRDYCQSNPLIVNACQPPIFNPNGTLAANDGNDTLFTAPYRANGNDAGKTTLSTKADTGSVYGIGYRRQDRRIFAAAYAKRGVAYGPGGPGAIYVVPAEGGPTTVWGKVPDVGNREHSFETGGDRRQDWDFAPAVTKESLGDLDISEDGDDLQVINLHNRKLYVYDATAPTMGQPTHVVDLSSNPGCATADDWRPGALAERNGVLYVGGVCSAESTQDPDDQRAIILTYDAETYQPTGTAMDQSINRKREAQWFLAASCDPRDHADGVISTSFRPWSDTISCLFKGNGRLPDPQAWMDDIVVENNGDLVMAFRDRTGDQQLGQSSRYFENTDGTGDLVGVLDYVVAGDINKACPPAGGGQFVLDINGGCGVEDKPQTEVSGEYYGGDGGVHEEEAYGGLALSRGERGIATSAMDAAGGIFTQGYFRVDRGTGQPLRASGGGIGEDPDETLLANGGNSGGNRMIDGDSFSKGQGMADMEVLCDFAPVQIGNRVWDDENGNGIQDPGEAGIPGVTVNLYDAAGTLVATKVTNSVGEYYFDSVDDGVKFNTDYTIKLDNPEDYADDGPVEADTHRLTPNDRGAGPRADRLDSDGTMTDGYPAYAITTGPRGADNHTYDFGFQPKLPPAVSVGDYVWFDQNKDGIQDPDEEGIAGVVLKLTGPDGQPVTDVLDQPVGPVTTDANGAYSFDRLPPLPAGEHYTVTIDQGASQDALEGTQPTQAGAGDPATDSSTDSATSGDLVNDGDRDSTLDFGFIKPAVSVGDLVWLDDDRDGIQDAGEPGIEGVVLTLTGPDGNPVTDVLGKPVAPVTTDEDGHYSFDNLPVLPAGQHYTVTIDKTASATALRGLGNTLAGEGDDEGADSSTDSATSGDLVNDGDRDPSLDFGFVRKGSVSVGDYVWLDDDKDGVQDAEEAGIEGVVLKLTDSNGDPVVDVDGNPVGPVTTDADGKYLFDNLPILPAGQHYTVTVDRPASGTALTGLGSTTAGAGDDEGADSSTDTATSGDLTVDRAEDLTLDFGFVKLPSVAVGDLVWLDKNKDGVQGPGEKGIPGVVLTLTGPDGGPVLDVDGNPVDSVTTDADGNYLFPNLPVLAPGESYTVTLDEAASGSALDGLHPTTAGAGDDEGADSSTGSASSGDLTTDGAKDLSLDFGFTAESVSVGDYVWLDANGDGLQDEDEKGIKGVVLTLTGPDGNPVVDVFGKPVKSVVTNGDGAYSFDNLPVLDPGQSYTVTIDKGASAIALKGLTNTTEGAGDPAEDSSTDSATSTGLTADGDRDSTLDFGFVKVPSVSVGDLVWLDVDKDGVQDPNEPGIAGVTLELIGPAGGAVTDVNGNPVQPVQTGSDGKYVFDALPVLQPGEHYTVRIREEDSEAALEGKSPTPPGVGEPDGDSSTGAAESGPLTEDGDIDDTLDFGFVAPSVSVGDFVWVDKDKDGVQDAGEPGIPGVVLKLTGPNGRPVRDIAGNTVGSLTTDANGAYSFDGLPPLPAGQHYTVTIERNAASTKKALAPYLPTKAGQGGDSAADSSTWTATSGDLTADGDQDLTLDFGFVPIPPAPPAPPGVERPQLSTKAARTVKMRVNRQGAVRPVALRDSVTVSGLTGTGSAVASLYGPVAKRSAAMCAPTRLVGSVTFGVRNGTARTPAVTVTEPGVYTWVVTVTGSTGAAVSHGCGIASETTTVRRPAYAPVRIETGVAPPGLGDPLERRARPTTLSAPALGKPIVIADVGRSHRQMQLPSSKSRAGWLRFSAGVDEVIGKTVVAAHVSDNHDNPMAFWKLKKLRKGTVITITEGGHVYRFKVTMKKRFKRTGKPLPKRFFTTTGRHKLVLVSCTDKVVYPNGHFHYAKNLVVVATPIN